MIVTVAVPVFNGEQTLGEVLSAVSGQRVAAQVEILVLDSSSTDDSAEISGAHGAVVYQIPRSQYSHGGSRNLIMKLASGEFVAFLTQDATPAHEGWLAALLEGFEVAVNVGAVFGPHLPRPTASHMIARELEHHFATWGSDIAVQQLERSPRGLAEYRANPGKMTFLSDVNCCIRRTAWEHVPYREVPYAEDQLLGRELIEAGYAKVFHPRAQVFHSHDYRPVTFVRRYFDEYRGLREVLDYREPSNPLRTIRTIRDLAAADRDWLAARDLGTTERGLGYAKSLRHHTLRQFGAVLGSHADRLPSIGRRVLSLEGRSTFRPYHVPESPLLGHARNGGPPVTAADEWEWNFVRGTDLRRPLTLSPCRERHVGPLTIAFVVPPWGIGSGGHMTIFRLVEQLEQRGHHCVIFVFDPFRHERRPARLLRDEVRENFVPIDAPVLVGVDDFDSADIAVATNWWTAYPVRELPRCHEKVYLVQDHEPEFHATSAQSVWAANTYRMGLRCVAFTPWLVDLLESEYGAEARLFEYGTDTETYRFAPFDQRETDIVAVYARQETERRAVELAFAALATLHERRPSVRTILFGSSSLMRVPFPCENLGVIPPRQLASLYQRASVGVALSLTNLSLVSLEMLACGLPLVELDVPSVRSVLGASGDLALLANPIPDEVATAIERALDDAKASASRARRGREFVEGRSWERAGETLEAALHTFLASPRQSSDSI
jgi:glycosyltransferase involved in cell wall biosynthesis/GT2 family glycosyltransferase